MSWAKPVAPILGIDNPPLASTSASASTGPRSVSIRNRSGFSIAVTLVSSQIWTCTAAHSASSIARISRAEPSQNSWPRLRSW